MNISGIRTYAGFYDYNTIKNQETHGRQIAEAKAQTSEDVAVQKEEQAAVTPKKPDNGASEYAKQYQPDAAYELKGADSDIANLDVEKALSDMKKDQVLQQYQFFVGESNVGEALARRREEENFYL